MPPPITVPAVEALRDDLVELFFRTHPEFFPDVDGYLDSPEGQADVDALLYVRLQQFRDHVVPWLNTLRPMAGCRVLEIGCGPGASTVALAEAGAHVVGTDIDQPALEFAAKYLAAHEVAADLRVLDAAVVSDAFAEGEFDLVVFWATLEHMTLQERLSSLAGAWSLLKEQQILAIVDTPNRLWIRDDHTAMEPFFHWLPDDLALLYAGRTQRPNFNEAHLSALELARWGRSTSYHDIEVALGMSLSELDVAAELPLPPYEPGSVAETHAELLRKVMPSLPLPFRREYLNLALRK